MPVTHHPRTLPPNLSTRWFRTSPDSFALDRPRLLARSLVDVAELDQQIAFYERLLGVPADLRMPIPDFGGLELAAVGNLLLIGSARPFTPIQRQTAFSLIVPSLRAQLERLRSFGGTTVLEPPERILPGSRARVRLPDGQIAELVEHRPQPGERPDPPAESGARTDGGVRLLARHAVPVGALDDAVRQYEHALETTAESRIRLGGSDEALAAVVGSLLLVGSDQAEPAEDRRAAFALLTFRARDRHPEGGPRTVVLDNGVPAEVWEASWR